MVKTASTSSEEPKSSSTRIRKISRHEDVRIVSKRIEHSHYFIYLDFNTVKKDGDDLYLVSVFMQEGYLGRYLIKRNFFFRAGSYEAADECFEDLLEASNEICDAYYSDDLYTSDIFPAIKKMVDLRTGEVEDEYVSIGTGHGRDRDSGHEAYGPYYISQGQSLSSGIPKDKKTSSGFDVSSDTQNAILEHLTSGLKKSEASSAGEMTKTSSMATTQAKKTGGDISSWGESLFVDSNFKKERKVDESEQYRTLDSSSLFMGDK